VLLSLNARYTRAAELPLRHRQRT